MKACLKFALWAFVITALASPACAQEEAEDLVSAIAGEWLLAPEDGRPGCRVQLGRDATIGGMAIELAADCAQNVPQLADAAAWRFSNAGIAFADATRKTVLTFVESEDATWATEGEPGSKLLLTKAPAGVLSAPRAKDLFGRWGITGEKGKSVCRINLLSEPPAAGQASYGLKVESGCEKPVNELKLVSWKIEGMQLVLLGKDGESLSFGADGNGAYELVQAPADKVWRLTRP